MHIFEWSFFGIQISPTWYWFMYAIGFSICYIFVKKYGYLRKDHIDDFLIYIFFGVVLGWRLGYVLLYDLPYFVAHPSDVFAVWKWGMSFHGWALWVIFALLLFSWRKKYSLYDLADPLVAILPLALWLGRIGNAINGELPWYSPYSWPFPMMIDSIPHFPSPLLQAFLEGIVLLFIMQSFRKYEQRNGRTPWRASAIFLIGYGILRIFAEFFRLPDTQIGYLFGTQWITLGMMYSLPLIFWGIYLYFLSKKKIISSVADTLQEENSQ